MTPESLQSRLGTHVIGRKIICLDTCSSTNDAAWKEALEGAPEGTVLFADEQTKGRGRFGRVWEGVPGKSILCSTILRPGPDADAAALITVIGALAAADAVGEEARIRFPNDVMLEGKKVAGVLVEARLISGRPDLFILGIGLNVNAHPAGVGAGSLGAEASRSEVARDLLRALDAWYSRIDGGVEKIRRAWRARSFIVGKRVRVEEGGKAVRGVVEDVDPVDGIVLRLESGHPRTFRGESVAKLDVL